MRKRVKYVHYQKRFRFRIQSGHVLKHGPRSLTCMQVHGIIKTYRRNEHNLFNGIINNINYIIFPSPGILM
jgi:hypothetical protein